MYFRHSINLLNLKVRRKVELETLTPNIDTEIVMVLTFLVGNVGLIKYVSFSNLFC